MLATFVSVIESIANTWLAAGSVTKKRDVGLSKIVQCVLIEKGYSVTASVRRYFVRSEAIIGFGASTFKLSDVLRLSEPEVPSNVTDCEAEAVLVVAENVIVDGVPGVRFMGEGEIVTPAGSPVTCTATDEEKPFEGVAESDVVVEPPERTETEEGVTANSKSGVGGGGGCEPSAPLLPLLPHPQKITARSSGEMRRQPGRHINAQKESRAIESSFEFG